VRENTKVFMKKKKKKSKRVSKIHRVYVTYFPDGRYYIGYSCKPEKQFEKYFGSSSIIKETDETLQKEVLLQTSKRNHAKIQEFLLQWQCRHDSMCLNDMIHIRLRLSHLKDFTPISWTPKHSTDTFVDTLDGYKKVT